MLTIPALISAVASGSTCDNFPKAERADAEALIDKYIGDKTLAAVTDGRAWITHGSAAIVTRSVGGSVPITKNFLASRGNTIYHDCPSSPISGSVNEGLNHRKTCLLASKAISMC